ncbi:hypothetical protein [Paenibacillus silvisoli]|uniref:hypothetical protein n=1 Tax=Paenibacillus silvisoli TaxID=3110539 RepID=UPI002803D3AA|nr:hypothetical protein [Paenibacillus silvisoli]
MNWKVAKERELNVIAFDDEHASFSDKINALAEIMRRKSKQYGKLKQTEKAHYPK